MDSDEEANWRRQVEQLLKSQLFDIVNVEISTQVSESKLLFSYVWICLLT